MGRVGIDLYPSEPRTPLREQRRLMRFVGGFAGNVSTGLARLGVRTAIVSRVGAEGNGDFVRDFLTAEGVDVRFLATDPYWQTPPTFIELWPPDRFPILFYRRPTVPDWQLAPGDFDLEEVAGAPLLYATGTALAQSPSRETTLAALGAHRGLTIFDLDWRPALWERSEDYARLVSAGAGAADFVLGNEEEIEAAGGSTALLGRSVTLVVKRGERGAVVLGEGLELEVPGREVEVANGLGAGDAFAAAFGHSVLRGLSLEEAVRRANVAGSLVVARLACSEAMPTLAELEAELRIER